MLTSSLFVRCPLLVASTTYTHEGVLYKSLAWALAVDAIAHVGPASVDRIDHGVCELFLPGQLGLGDLLG